MKLTILGSGTSTGVPEIGCTCPVCTSADPRDSRLRASALLHTDDAVILIDCGPDFRTQMLRASVYERIDGVLVCNPGSISLPRGGPASYARLTIENAQLRAVTLLDEDGGLIRRDKFRQ